MIYALFTFFVSMLTLLTALIILSHCSLPLLIDSWLCFTLPRCWNLFNFPLLAAIPLYPWSYYIWLSAGTYIFVSSVPNIGVNSRLKYNFYNFYSGLVAICLAELNKSKITPDISPLPSFPVCYLKVGTGYSMWIRFLPDGLRCISARQPWCFPFKWIRIIMCPYCFCTFIWWITTFLFLYLLEG